MGAGDSGGVLLQIQLYLQLPELFVINGRWRIQHNIPARVVFREGDKVADAFAATEDGTQAVETKGQATMRRRISLATSSS